MLLASVLVLIFSQLPSLPGGEKDQLAKGRSACFGIVFVYHLTFKRGQRAIPPSTRDTKVTRPQFEQHALYHTSYQAECHTLIESLAHFFSSFLRETLTHVTRRASATENASATGQTQLTKQLSERKDE